MKWNVLAFLLCHLAICVCGQESAVLYGTVLNQAGEAIPFAQIYNANNIITGTSADESGYYELELELNKTYKITISHISYGRISKTVLINESRTPLNIFFNQSAISIPRIDVESRKEREEISTVKVNIQEAMLNPSGSLETTLLFQGLGVSGASELSSAYSVRGGNFDENLVYVNDFEVYRPFLIRSGQQEGLSFANPSLVESISFSSGGFQSKYGDKLSSVLDIEYKTPTEFKSSIYASLLGFQAHMEGATKDRRVRYLLGFRNKSNRILLSSLDTKGEYLPFFVDFQSFISIYATDKLSFQVLSNYSKNRFEFRPENRETDFGTVTQVIRFQVFFEGGERDIYDALTNGISAIHRPSNKLELKWLGSYYRTNEKEAYDILGEYFLGEVETDFSKENFDQVRFSLGSGGIHRWARNNLYMDVFNLGHRGRLIAGNQNIKWGFNAKKELIQDNISEWERLDSAFYTVPYFSDSIVMDRYLRSSINLNANRYTAFLQSSWKKSDSSRFLMTYGSRVHYWDINKEWVVSPRWQMAFQPRLNDSLNEKDLYLTAAIGLYQQPPFYREMRKIDGTINTALKAQKSAHFVVGADYQFYAWNRPFRFITEAYYKQMWNLVPYEFDNVLIRYFGENNAKGYTAGLDMRLQGQLVKEDESWINISFLQTREDILDDFYFEYYDSTGARVVNGSPEANPIVDSSRIEPGFLPRPTDRRVNFGLFFQDHLPKAPQFKVHLNLLFGTGLPFGPPDQKKYNDVFRIPAYKRVDIGFSARLYDKQKKIDNGKVPKGVIKGVRSAWANLEVYNMLGIPNTISYLWVKDLRNFSYAIPNTLTARRVNLRVVVKFGAP